MSTSNSNMKKIVVPVETKGRTHWRQAGVAFESSEGAYNIRLDVFPGVTFRLCDFKSSSSSGTETADEGSQPPPAL